MWFNIDITIVILFLIVNFAVGFGIRKKESNLNDFKTYSIGNFKNPSVLFLAATSVSCLISGGYFIALIQQSYTTGIAYILKNILFEPLAYVLTVFFVLPLNKNTKKIGVTLNEWMDEKIHSSFFRALMGVAELLFFFSFLIMQFKAFGIIAKSFFNLPPQYEKMCVIGFAIFLSFYTFKGGFVSVVLTDIFQFWVFIIAFISLVIFITFKTNFFAGVWERGVLENPQMSIMPCFKDYNAIIFTLGIWLKTVFPRFNGPRYQRVIMCNDTNKVKKSLLCTAGIVAFFTIFCVYIGLLIYSKNPNLTMSEIIPFFVSNYCPTGLKGLLGAGLFAMSISTAESALNNNAVILTNDILPLFHKMVSKKIYLPSVFVARMFTILLTCIGVLIAFYMGDIFSIFMTFGNFYYPVAIIPSIVLILGVNVQKASVMCGVFCGILATLLNYIFTGNLSSFFLGLIANLSGLLLMELFFRMKTNKKMPSFEEKG